MDVIIYHNPACGTSRTTLGLIRNAGIEPHVIDYQKCPPSRAMVAWLAQRAGLNLIEVMRQRGTPFHEIGLDRAGVDQMTLLDAITRHPILLERPLVVSPKCVRLCRPATLVLDLLPPQRGEFFTENGERLIDEHGRIVASV